MLKKASRADHIVRCAIYTRKSTAAGLDMEVNSLQTQREVCQAYIRCQAHRRWTEVTHHYDDGGHSGGSTAILFAKEPMFTLPIKPCDTPMPIQTPV